MPLWNIHAPEGLYTPAQPGRPLVQPVADLVQGQSLIAAVVGVEVVLEQRVRGVAPGQSVVLYDGSRVVGSATIARTGTAAR